MKKFKVYFEIYDKKMVTTVEAENEEEAKKAVFKRIIFHDVKTITDSERDIVNRIDETLDKIVNFIGNAKVKPFDPSKN
jgi:hypothetical protein